MTLSYARILTLGDTALTVEFGNQVDPTINDRVLAFAQAVEARHIPGVIEVVPTYRSATIYFDPAVVEPASLEEALRSLAEQAQPAPRSQGRIVRIPVSYGGECGPDLDDLAKQARLTSDEVTTLHASVQYRVYMLGFSPGFPYLGPVPEPIAAPRLARPRVKVPAGSVGIAGRQTGIYPQESPGGWRIIGRTPVKLFDLSRTRPFLLDPGDRVKFIPIDRHEFERLCQVDR